MTSTEARATVVTTREALQEALRDLRESGASIGLVPTMGALHEGHLALVDRANALADATVMSIFVNPTQFGPGEDLDRYPRDLDADVRSASARGVDLIFAPDDDVMYRDGDPEVRVDPGPMAEGLCGAYRPGHFRGVLTVVLKLFSLIRPDTAVFGRKDLQQAALIRRMVQDFDLPIEIDLGPVVRDSDGLALSSRNRYLTAAEREQALGLIRALWEADRMFREGETAAATLLRTIRGVIADHPGLALQYAEAVDPITLVPLRTVGPGSALAVAGFCGATRLIDNVLVGVKEEDPRVPGGTDRAGGSE